MAFRKFGTFRTPNGWLTTTGDGELLQRGTKRGEEEAVAGVEDLNNQFEVNIVSNNGIFVNGVSPPQIRIKRGTVIAGIGKMVADDPPKICNRQFYIRNVFASTLSSNLGGNNIEEIVNNNGTLTLPSSPVMGAQSGHVCIWIARNVHVTSGNARVKEGYPFLIADVNSGTLDVATRPWGTDGCDAIEWYIIDDLATNFVAEQQFHFKLASVRKQSQKNYNCQRFKIADVKYENGAWKVYQRWLGTVTLPHPYSFKGILECVDQYPYDSVPTWRFDPQNNIQQQGWENAMIMNDRGHTNPTIYETIP